MGRRCKIDLDAEILASAKEPVAPTSLITVCGLNSASARVKIDFLVSCGLLTVLPVSGGRRLVQVSERGKRFLMFYRGLDGLY